MSDVVGYRLASQERRAPALKDRVQQLLAPFDGTERALDSGCGAGALAFALASFVERVVGVDRSTELVAAGNELAPSNCELIVGDATALPFEYFTPLRMKNV
jgi:ubiquinone/menaquinone biosynthesis C-methylase UbiE